LNKKNVISLEFIMPIDYCRFIPPGSKCYDSPQPEYQKITPGEFATSNTDFIMQKSPQFAALDLPDLKSPDIHSLGAFNVIGAVILILAGLFLVLVGKRSFKTLVSLIGALVAGYITFLFLVPLDSFGTYRTAVLILAPLLAALIGGALLKAMYKVLTK
jgi:hypothetical protein